MINLSDKSVLCYDYGNFFEVAVRLSRDFGNVYYYCPKVITGFPTHNPVDIGRNVPNVIRVQEWADVINQCELIVFCDAYEPGLQSYFKSIGKAVFGSGHACELENNRKRLKEVMSFVDLPVGDYDIANGIDELEEILKTKENVFIKHELRGDGETWFHERYELSKLELQRMRSKLGVFQTQPTYIIEDKLESIAEIGIDTMIAKGGRYLAKSITGIELKDTGFLARITPYIELPHQLRSVTDKLAPVFSDYDYRGSMSNEVIISKDMKGYLIDLTNRCPEPPTALILEMYDNYSEMVWMIANGDLPQVKHTYSWGVQLIIKSEIAKNFPSPIIIPEEYQKFVKIKNLVIDEQGVWYYTPQPGVNMNEIGAVIGMGHTMQAAINQVKQVAESIKGFDIKINTGCIEEALEQIRNLKKNGINYLS